MTLTEEVAREGVCAPALAPDATGRGVRVAVVDTGVNFEHPHLRLPARGVGLEWEDGEIVVREGWIQDPYGHGTCCAALIHLLAPDAELVAVRVTGERATTDSERLARGIEWGARSGARVISVAMGTETAAPAPLEEAVAIALQCGAVVIAASPGGVIYPAACAGALAVSPRDGVDVALLDGEVVAEGRARPAPRLPRNFHGASLATARASAAVARFAQSTGDRGEALLRSFKSRLIVL